MKASGIDFSSILTYSCVLVVLNSFVSCVYSTTVSIHVHEHDEATATSRYPVAKLNFAEISEIYEIALWILLGSLAKIGKRKKLKKSNLSRRKKCETFLM